MRNAASNAASLTASLREDWLRLVKIGVHCVKLAFGAFVSANAFPDDAPPAVSTRRLASSGEQLDDEDAAGTGAVRLAIDAGARLAVGTRGST